MNGLLLIYRPGTAGVEHRALTAPPTLEQLRAAVGGGFIELVPGFDKIEHEGTTKPCAVFCDEEGKLKPSRLSRVNYRATDLWYAAYPRVAGQDLLVGDVAVVIGDDELLEAL